MNRAMRPLLAAATLLAYIAIIGTAPAEQTETRPPSWRDVKCDRYRQAWAEVRARYGIQGLGLAFLERHDAFMASGCTAGRDVCPRTGREMELANILTVAAMNAGTASTFLPFACPK